MKVDQSFEDFVDARSSALLRTAYLLVGDRGHAEDLVQTALLRAARHWSRAREAPEAYVRRTMVNLTHDRTRRLFRRPREAPLAPEDESIPGTEPGYGRVDDRRVVVHALSRLPLRQRQVIVLRFVEDLSVEQTAELLNCSTGTVKSYTARALARLRELIGEDEQDRTREVPHVR